MKKNRHSIDNQGFSLVELVVVMAIMAILVGIVGTQVVPYLDKTRKAKDVQLLSAWCTAATTAYTSCSPKLDMSVVYEIHLEDGSATVKGGTDAEQSILIDDFSALSGVSATDGFDVTDFTSKAGKDIKEVVIVCKQSDNPIVKLDVINNTPGEYSFQSIETK